MSLSLEGYRMPKISKTKTAVLDAFESRSDDWTFADFEESLEKAMGPSYGNYQTAKGVILDAHATKRWPRTVKRWILTNHRSFGNLPVEMQQILNDIYPFLTQKEKDDHKIK